MNCVDVSEWNGEIDWELAKMSGVDYAIIRCGFGRNGIDKYFNINMEEAKIAGVKIGVRSEDHGCLHGLHQYDELLRI